MRIIQRIQDAIANEPDLAENSEYQSAKGEQEINEVRIAELEINSPGPRSSTSRDFSGETIKFGAIVTLLDEDTARKGNGRLLVSQKPTQAREKSR